MKKPADRNKTKQDYEELLIRLAMERYAAEEGEALLKENERLGKEDFYRPSDIAMQKLVRKISLHQSKQSLFKWFTSGSSIKNRIAIIFLIVLAVFFTSLVSVEAFRIQIYNFFVEMQDDHTEIRLTEKTDVEVSGYGVGEYMIRVPSDYKLSRMDRNRNQLTVTYENSLNEIIIFEQSRGHAATNLDSEESDMLEEIHIHGYKGIYSRKKNIQSLVWSDNEHIFYISTDAKSVTKTEIVDMGENLKKK